MDELSRAREATPEDRLLRAELARAEGNLEAAALALEGFPRDHPGSPAARLTLGLLRHQLGRAAAARADLVAFLAGEAGKIPAERADWAAQARRALLRIALTEGDFAAVDRILGELVASESTTLDFNEAALWTLGKPIDLGPAEIASELERRLEVEPTDMARLALCRALLDQGKPDEAEAAVRGLADAGSPPARVARARTAFARGEFESVRALLDRGFGPTQGDRREERERLALLGRLDLTEGRASDAAEAFRASLDSGGDDREAMFGLSQALRLQGREQEAQPWSRRVAARDSLERRVQQARVPAERDDPRVLGQLGEICESMGKRGPALAWYRLAAARAPTDAKLQAAVRRLMIK
ncbi:MAG: tetratricopeptide repeat protein [Isosphaeraceae bacterium]|nr:tetratricopeptide repeat protein [Isosphaeraceae bacterium]